MAESNNKVYKDQCAFCFNTPEMPDGLLICVKHKFAYCQKHTKIHHEIEKCNRYVRFIRLRRRLDKETPPSVEQPPETKITKLAIGLEGGCLIEPKFEACDSWTVIDNYPDLSTEHNANAGDAQVQNIVTAESAYRLRELEALAGTWDGSQLVETKHRELMQLPFNGKIPTKGWRCQHDVGACDKTENLWMNLTDGKILCGRRNFDGSGGNNHALDHYNKTKYPLAVNLGTITSQTADVYSYDEDDMVLDPHLAKHLRHFGINMMEMEKTEKTMLEKELDLNKTWEYASIQEDGRHLTPAFGAGFVGIHNLGNSCYMNSLLQSFVQMPEVMKPVVQKSDFIFRACKQNPYEDMWVQTAKIFSALTSPDYSDDPEVAPRKEGFEPPENGIRPYDFRHIIGKGHAEFSTKKQQDVEEYARFLTEKFQRFLNDLQHCAPNCDPLLPTSYLAHVTEDHGKFKYFTPDCVYDVDFDVAPRPPNASGADGNHQRPSVNLYRRLKEMIERPETVKTGRIVRFATFPQYLLVKVNRHSITDDWKPVKLDYSLEVDGVLDLNFMRASLPKDSDNIVVDKSQPAAAAFAKQQAACRSRSPSPASVNTEHLTVLQSMGFSNNACMKALKATGGNDVNAALDWIMSRMGDPGLDLPETATSTSPSNTDKVDMASLNMLLESGFTEAQGRSALRKCKNNIEAAFSYLLDGGGMDVEENSLPEPAERSKTPPPVSVQSVVDKLKSVDGNGVYKLLGVISHIGSSTRTGHYVYHGLKENNRWAIFNDEKVAWSESPPVAFGYVYVFKRV